MKETTDDWWRVRNTMDQYTNKLKETMYAFLLNVLDETISVFIPQTTKSGNLPNLSFIKRKPEPSGTEFKVAMDGIIGKSLWLEIQEG